jgi:hypothetical protein
LLTSIWFTGQFRDAAIASTARTVADFTTGLKVSEKSTLGR